MNYSHGTHGMHDLNVKLFVLTSLIGLVLKFALPKYWQDVFCQNLDKYFVRWTTSLDSNQMSAKILARQILAPNQSASTCPIFSTNMALL